MHGVIFAELRNYAESKHGPGTWDALLKRQTSEAGRIFLYKRTQMLTRWL